jgi:isopentenyl-diphosphate Delta-isomerase
VQTEVVTLDADARPDGRMEKMAAHRPPGQAHLAFSVLLESPDDRVLLQRRADGKHHFRGAWANTCCSHPAPDEPLVAAARRRLREELGLEADLELECWGAFWYRAVDEDSGLVEVEYDVVVRGRLDEGTALAPDPAEVAETAWVSWSDAMALAVDDEVVAAPWLAKVLHTASGAREPLPDWLPC